MINHSKEQKEILDYYDAGVEKERLRTGIGKIEFERTKEIISRYLGGKKQVIYDIGGGTGEYSRWLAGMEHEVHLLELSPNAVEYAREMNKSLKQSIFEIQVAAISSYGSTLWGLSMFGQKNHFIDDNVFFEMIERELTDGQHVRPEKYPGFIARAFFHLPGELKEEIHAAGFKHEKTMAVEGPVWIVPAFEEKWANDARKE